MKKLLLLLIIPLLSFGQGWEYMYEHPVDPYTYSSFASSKLLENEDGSFVVAGHIKNNNQYYKTFILKLNSSGEEVWSTDIELNLENIAVPSNEIIDATPINSPTYYYYNDILKVLKTDEGYAVFGRCLVIYDEIIPVINNQLTNYATYMVKLDESGNKYFEKIFNTIPVSLWNTDGLNSVDPNIPEIAGVTRKVFLSTNGDYNIISYDYLSASPALYLTKLNNQGDILYQNLLTEDLDYNLDNFHIAKQNGFFYIVGYFNSNVILYSFYDNQSNDLVYGFPKIISGMGEFNSMEPTSDGGVILSGKTPFINNLISVQGVVVKFSPNEEEWSTIIPDLYPWYTDFYGYWDHDSEITTIKQTPDGGYIMIGLEDGNSPQISYYPSWFKLKLNSEGQILWHQQLLDEYNSIVEINTGECVLAGPRDLPFGGSMQPNPNLTVRKLTNKNILNNEGFVNSKKLIKKIDILGRVKLKIKVST